MYFIKLFCSTFIVLLLIDISWVGLIAKNIYLENLSHLLNYSNGAFSPNGYAAILVYVLVVVGIICFVLPQANGNYLRALIWGAVFGLVIYGIYNFTNFATLTGWPLNLSFIDLAWGIILCAVVSVFATFMQKMLS